MSRKRKSLRKFQNTSTHNTNTNSNTTKIPGRKLTSRRQQHTIRAAELFKKWYKNKYPPHVPVMVNIESAKLFLSHVCGFNTATKHKHAAMELADNISKNKLAINFNGLRYLQEQQLAGKEEGYANKDPHWMRKDERMQDYIEYLRNLIEHRVGKRERGTGVLLQGSNSSIIADNFVDDIVYQNETVILHGMDESINGLYTSYIEWYKGISKRPSIVALESVFGKRWRVHQNKLYYRRKAVMNEIQWCVKQGIPLMKVIRDLEYKIDLARDGGLESLETAILDFNSEGQHFTQPFVHNYRQQVIGVL